MRLQSAFSSFHHELLLKKSANDKTEMPNQIKTRMSELSQINQIVIPSPLGMTTTMGIPVEYSLQEFRYADFKGINQERCFIDSIGLMGQAFLLPAF
jgi:hypothetical protein